jgi:hypothetical protein
MTKLTILISLFLSGCYSGIRFDYLNADEEQTARLDCALSIVDEETANFSAGGTIEIVDYQNIIGFWQIDKDYGNHGDMEIRLATGDSPSVQVLAQGLTSLAGYVYEKEAVMYRVFQECR